jgi:AcrR family transcriptional regulator
MPRTRPRGRRSGQSETRSTILHAAQLRFARAGYGGVSMRAIAADAGVDSALVHHYFGTKQKLFAAANEMPHDPGAALRAALETPSPGEALVLAFLEAWDAPAGTSPLASLMRSAATDPDAQARLTDLIATTLVTPAAAAIARRHPMPKLRATLVAAQLAGLAWMRYVLRTDPLASASASMISKTFGPSIDATLASHAAS